MEERIINPTERGQVTIPKVIRERLGITSRTKLQVYLDGNKVVLEPVSPLDDLFKAVELEAKGKGYTREQLKQELDQVRERLFSDLYGKKEP